MIIGRLHREALAAYDLSRAALEAYWQSLSPDGSPPKLTTEQAQTLTQLSSLVERWQERIRIHRRQTIPGTESPRPRKPKKERRPAEVGAGLPIVPRPTTEGQRRFAPPPD